MAVGSRLACVYGVAWPTHWAASARTADGYRGKRGARVRCNDWRRGQRKREGQETRRPQPAGSKYGKEKSTSHRFSLTHTLSLDLSISRSLALSYLAYHVPTELNRACRSTFKDVSNLPCHATPNHSILSIPDAQARCSPPLSITTSHLPQVLLSRIPKLFRNGKWVCWPLLAGKEVKRKREKANHTHLPPPPPPPPENCPRKANKNEYSSPIRAVPFRHHDENSHQQAVFSP